ncbi:MAG: AgmX/PglI C-terminal domain-containing protein [Pseudobdellovibrionaceae bacterium]|nr:AgmX/PglI C-terminal domain-containing protein [Pseudobdellovibrionaceae bacterium]
MYLVVQKKFKNKSLRSWKLNYKKGFYVAGASRKADIYLPWSREAILFGCQFVDQKWCLLNLTGSLGGDFVVKPIEEKTTINIEEVQIDLIPISSQVVYAPEEEDREGALPYGNTNNAVESRNVGVLCFKKNGPKLVSSQLLTLDQFKDSFPQFDPSGRWQRLLESKETQEKLYCKVIPLHTDFVREVKKEPSTHDPNVFWMRMVTIFIFIVGIGLYLFLPDEKSASEFAKSQIPPQINLRREVRVAKRESQQVEQAPQSAPVSQNIVTAKPIAEPQLSKPAAYNAQSRLAKMLAKFSTQNVTSKNRIVVTEAIQPKANEVQLKSFDSIQQIGGTVTGKKIHDGSGIGVGTLSERGGTGQIAGQRLGKAGVSVADSLDEEADVDGGLDPEVISSVIKKHLGEILFCYERQLSANPNLYGKVTVRFTIAGSGKVESSRIYQSSLKNDFVEKCINERVLKWMFPAPKGGTKVVVTYPFLLKNSN